MPTVPTPLRDIAKVVQFPSSQKPSPIVPKRLIEGVSERVDCFGEVVVPLNEAEAEAAIRRLIAQGDDDLVGLAFVDTGIIRTLDHQQRSLDLVGFGQGRAFHQ